MVRSENEKGEAYIDVVIGLFISYIVLALAIELSVFFNVYHRLTYLTEQVTRTAAMEGNINGTAVQNRLNELIKEEEFTTNGNIGYGNSSYFTVSFDGSEPQSEPDNIMGLVQLGKTIKCTTSIKVSLRLYGHQQKDLNYCLSCTKTAVSDHYWKTENTAEDYDKPGPGGDGVGGNPPKESKPEGYNAYAVISPKEIYIGREQYPLNVIVFNGDPSIIGWTSSDTTVATVDSNGLVTGVSPGCATITAKLPSGAKITATVTVKQ